MLVDSKCGSIPLQMSYTRVGSTLVEDTTRTYPMREFGIVQVYHSQYGVMTDYMRAHDSLSVELTDAESLYTQLNELVNATDSTVIDSLSAPDTSMANWERKYFLAVAGVYSPGSLPNVRPWNAEVGEGALVLGESIPNPGSLRTEISYSLGSDGLITLALFDSRGILVKTLVDAFMRRGEYSIHVDLSDLSQGVYFYNLKGGGSSAIRRLVVIR